MLQEDWQKRPQGRFFVSWLRASGKIVILMGAGEHLLA